MFLMKMSYDQSLPLPNPGDWLSRMGAADVLKVSHQTIARMVQHGTLKQYAPAGARATAMYWRPEVEQLLAARTIALPPRPERQDCSGQCCDYGFCSLGNDQPEQG